MLQEYITLHVQLGQTQGQILVRKSLLRTKTNSSPSTALLQKRLSPAPIKLLCGPFPCSGGFSEVYSHCCGSIQTSSCLDAAWKECSGILNCRIKQKQQPLLHGATLQRKPLAVTNLWELKEGRAAQKGSWFSPEDRSWCPLCTGLQWFSWNKRILCTDTTLSQAWLGYYLNLLSGNAHGNTLEQKLNELSWN